MASAQPVAFTDVASSSGIGAVRCHSVGGHGVGVAWLDFDMNGFPDLLVACGQADPPLYLFANLGNGSFLDVTPAFRGLPQMDMQGVAVGDVDNDGDPDLYVFTDKNQWGIPMDPDGPPNLLYRNNYVESGNTIPDGVPLFELAMFTPSGPDPVADVSWPPLGSELGFRSKSGGFLDYDNDACLDLYVGHFVGGAIGSPGNRNRLYRNNCDGTFTDVTEASQVHLGDDPDTFRASLAFVAAQLDSDTNIDMYVVNASAAVPQDHVDFLFHNNGDGTFSELISAGALPGIGNDAHEGMGVDVADINNDGNWDIYIGDNHATTLDDPPLGNVLYLGLADGSFSDNSAPDAGVDALFTWPLVFFDANQDGFQDLYVGYGGTPVYEYVDFLYINDGDGTFTDVGSSIWSRDKRTENVENLALQSRGAAVADFDRDGDLDLAVVSENGELLDFNPPLGLWRNDTVGAGNWLQIKLVGCASNRDAIGTVVKLQAGALSLMQQVKGAMSSNSQNDLVVHFGLGAADHADSIQILWPSGQTTELVHGSASFLNAPDDHDLSAGRLYTVIEGTGGLPGFSFSMQIPFEFQDFAYTTMGCGAAAS